MGNAERRRDDDAVRRDDDAVRRDIDAVAAGLSDLAEALRERREPHPLELPTGGPVADLAANVRVARAVIGGDRSV